MSKENHTNLDYIYISLLAGAGSCWSQMFLIYLKLCLKKMTSLPKELLNAALISFSYHLVALNFTYNSFDYSFSETDIFSGHISGILEKNRF